MSERIIVSNLKNIRNELQTAIGLLDTLIYFLSLPDTERGLTKRAVELGDSAASQALSQPEVLSTQQAESTPAPIH
jgi:hypothetical protein